MVSIGCGLLAPLAVAYPKAMIASAITLDKDHR
jgi:hypothetical protein